LTIKKSHRKPSHYIPCFVSPHKSLRKPTTDTPFSPPYIQETAPYGTAYSLTCINL